MNSMNLCLDLTTLSKGGGIQVAETLISDLQNKFSNEFSSVLILTNDNFYFNCNENFIILDLKNKLSKNLLINTLFINRIFKKYDINIVFTLFGPAKYFTSLKHIIGFARPHIVYQDSPYFNKLSIIKLLYTKTFYKLLEILFSLQSDSLIVETNDVKKRLELKFLLKKKKIFVVENSINQAFINFNYTKRNVQDKLNILFVSAYYDHKNFDFFIDLAKKLDNTIYKNSFKITLTINSNDLSVPDSYSKYFEFIGKVQLKNLPELYNNNNLVIHPSLLECFSACYIEAMFTRTMLIVPKLPFTISILEDYPFYINILKIDDTVDIILKKFSTYYLNNTNYSFSKSQVSYFNSNIRTEKYVNIIKSYHV
jgi:glycosyltransferase involved in cell wall biosynthesis